MDTRWLKRWLFTTNHKDVGILYLVTSFYFGFLAGILAFLMRTQLALPSESFLAPAQYSQAVTMHGILMVLWFLSPLGIAFANYFIPLQIGAADVAFARLNATSYWLYVFGGVVAFTSFFVPGGGPAGGWTNYAPLSGLQFQPGLGETLGVAGLVTIAASNTVGTINLLVTILWHRKPGMGFLQLPMFTMFMFWTLLQFLWAFPSLLAGLIMLEADRVLGTFFFTSPAGGSILWDHVWWFFAHPEVYIVLLPAFGIIAGILSTFSGRTVYARRALFFALGAIVLLSYMVYGHHMFLTGISLTEREVFTINTETISIPFAVVMLSFVGTLFRGVVRLTTPMLFSLGAIVIFVIGGLSGVFNSSLALDIALRGGYFVVAHFHYTMVGASEFGLFAGIYYWLPKMTGRLYSELLGKTHFVLSFVGFNMIFFPMFWLLDMPRRVASYTVADWAPFNFISTVGAYIFIPSQLIMVANMILTLRGPRSPSNPWNATELEWTAHPSPPETGHFGTTIGNGLGNGLGNGHVQAGTDVQHHEVTLLSTRPIVTCLGFAVTLAGVAYGWIVFIIGIMILAWGIGGWAWDDYHQKFVLPEEPEGNRWPFHGVPKNKLATWIFLSSEAVLFGVILGSYAYIRLSFPHWPPPGNIQALFPGGFAISDLYLGAGDALIAVTAMMTSYFALQAIRNGNKLGLSRWLGATLFLAILALLLKAGEWYGLMNNGFTWTNGLPGSTFWIATGVHNGHIIAGTIFLIYVLKSALSNHYSSTNHGTVENFNLYWVFMNAVMLLIFPLFYLI